MITIRRSAERGHFDHGWLDTYHSFSFGDYYDPEWMGFRSLRVINDDRVAPARGFPLHPHRDMEIITWVLSGALEHRDSTGGGGVLRPGDAQHMSAGTGVQHSESNPSPDEPVHLLQIWIVPEQRGLAPGYAQQHFPEAERRNRLRLIAAPDGADGALTIRQDARVYASLLDAGTTFTHALAPDRYAWLQVARGAVELNGQALATGDGAAINEETELQIVATAECELLLFDLS